MIFMDVSNVNGTVTWPLVKGIQGVYAKRSEGCGFSDWLFAGNKKAAQGRGFYFGRYHFARPDRNTPEAEAAYFLSLSPDLKTDTVKPVLDFETHPASADWAKRFCNYVQRKTGVPVVFYSYTAFEHELGEGARVLAGNPQWRADYGANDGLEHFVPLVGPWDVIALHQYTSNGRVPGVHGHVDLSSVKDLNVLLMPRPAKRVVNKVSALAGWVLSHRTR